MVNEDREIQFLGIAEPLKEKIVALMERLKLGAKDNKLLPIVSWVLATQRFDSDGGISETSGPKFVLGAIDRSKLTDEIIVSVGELEIALRIPEVYKPVENVRLYLDLPDGLIVNASASTDRA
jgi:hypothetical protein